jgi:hypothetical protein
VLVLVRPPGPGRRRLRPALAGRARRTRQGSERGGGPLLQCGATGIGYIDQDLFGVHSLRFRDRKPIPNGLEDQGYVRSFAANNASVQPSDELASNSRARRWLGLILRA